MPYEYCTQSLYLCHNLLYRTPGIQSKLTMLPSSILVLTATTLAPIVLGATSPSCETATSSYALPKFIESTNTFCSKPQVASSNIDGVSINYVANGSGCDSTACSSSFKSLSESCTFLPIHPQNLKLTRTGQKNNTISSTGSIDAGCGIYKFSIGNNFTTASSPTVSLTPSATGKPKVGTTALGTSSASMAKVSGGLILLVGGIFVVFM